MHVYIYIYIYISIVMFQYWAYPPFGALWAIRASIACLNRVPQSLHLSIRLGLFTTCPLYDLTSLRLDLSTTWPFYDLTSLRPGLFTTWLLYDLTSSRPDLFTTWPLYDLASLRLDLFTTWPHRSWEDHLQYTRPSFDKITLTKQSAQLPNHYDYQTTTPTYLSL